MRKQKKNLGIIKLTNGSTIELTGELNDTPWYGKEDCHAMCADANREMDLPEGEDWGNK